MLRPATVETNDLGYPVKVDGLRVEILQSLEMEGSTWFHVRRGKQLLRVGPYWSGPWQVEELCPTSAEALEICRCAAHVEGRRRLEAARRSLKLRPLNGLERGLLAWMLRRTADLLRQGGRPKEG
ncbi:MAG TPA: hypothetical protein VGO93_04865 [Candidatus Xenobia bacterium]|jgi:hypothetical protein